MMEYGTVVAARDEPYGDVLAADAAAGATALVLANASDFNEDGGTLVVTGDTTSSTVPYLSADLDTDTITLSLPLPVAHSIRDQVLVEPYSVDRVALVVIDGQGEAVSARVPHALVDRVPEGIRDPGTEERVSLDLDGDTWTVRDVLGQEPDVDGGYIEPDTLPSDGPTAPPAESPTLSTTGSSDAITVVAHGIVDPTTILDYYMDGVLIESTRSTVLVVRDTPTGEALAEDTPYGFHVVARNEVDAAAPSPTVTGSLNPGVNSELIQAIVRAGFVLAGVIEVGNIRISAGTGAPGDPDYDPGGIVIPLSSGGEIRFPADGSAASIEAILRTGDLTVNGGLIVNGSTNYINGKMFMASGTANPTQVMGLDYTSSRFRERFNGTATTAQSGRGLTRLPDGSRWGIINSLANYAKELLIIDAATLNIVARVHNDDAALNNITGVTATSAGFWIIGDRWNATSGQYEWRIHKYSTSGASLGSSWLMDHVGNRLTTAIAYLDGAIAATPSGSLMVARTNPNGRIRFLEYPADLSGGNNLHPTSSFLTAADGPVAEFLSGGMYVGNADFGVQRIVVSGDVGDINGNHVYATGGAYQTAERWATQRPNGLFWDGTRFVGLLHDPDGAYLANYNTHKTDTTVYGKYTWYDNNATGGNKESAPSPQASKVIPKRCYPLVSIPAPPNSGSGDDAANAVRVYLNTTTTVKLLDTITSGQATTYTASALAGTGGNAPATSTFTEAASSGEVASANGRISLKGDGSGKAGPYQWTALGAAIVNDSGTMTATHAAVVDSAIRFREIAPGTILLVGYMDIDTDIGTGYVDIGLTAPTWARPAVRQDFPGHVYVDTGGARYRYRLDADGKVWFQQTGVSPQVASFNYLFLK